MLNRAHVAGRYTLIPDREAVTVHLVRQGAVQQVEVSDAWRKPSNLARLVAEGVSVNGTEEEWHVPDILFNPDANGRRIEVEDRIITSETPAVVWVVIRSQLKTLRTDWVCTCQRVRV